MADLRRTTPSEAPALLLRYVPGDSLASATFTRASVATYVQSIADTLLRYTAGDSMSVATFTRASVATLTGNA